RTWCTSAAPARRASDDHDTSSTAVARDVAGAHATAPPAGRRARASARAGARGGAGPRAVLPATGRPDPRLGRGPRRRDGLRAGHALPDRERAVVPQLAGLRRRRLEGPG